VTSLRFQLLLAAVAVALVAILVRSWFGAALAAVAVAVNVVVLAPLYTADRDAASGRARLQLAHVNMQGEDGDFGVLERELDERRPDVFVILEPPLDWLIRLERDVPGFEIRTSGRGPVVLLTRTEVTNVVPPVAEGLPDASVQFDVRLGGQPVRVLAVHTLAPTTSGRRNTRDEELAGVERWARGNRGPEIVLGDLNAVPWSSAIEDVKDAGDLMSSSDDSGWQPTWPALVGPLGIPIDQLLYSDGLTVTDREVGPTFGSEHRTLWVTLARSGASSGRRARDG
jgi:endonuclease/exonuclease/phosphatase (EEP) superfamily protein YafD